MELSHIMKKDYNDGRTFAKSSWHDEFQYKSGCAREESEDKSLIIVLIHDHMIDYISKSSS